MFLILWDLSSSLKSIRSFFCFVLDCTAQKAAVKIDSELPRHQDLYLFRKACENAESAVDFYENHCDRMRNSTRKARRLKNHLQQLG
jgi:hypothetical protein